MTNESPAPIAETLVNRIVESVVGTMDVFGVYLGHKLGYYRALADGGPATSSELTARTPANSELKNPEEVVLDVQHFHSREAGFARVRLQDRAA